MKNIITLFIFTLSLNSYANNCEGVLLRPEVSKLLKGVIVPRTNAITDKENFAKYYGQFSTHLFYIIDDDNSDTDEAISYLINVHIGDHSMKEISCEAQRRGSRMLSMIKNFQQCLPLTGLEPLHEYFKPRSSYRAKSVITNINNKLHCTSNE